MKWRGSRMLFGALGFALLLPVVAQAAPDPTPDQVIAVLESAQAPGRGGQDNAALAKIMARYHVPGVSVAVIRNYQVVWSHNWGVADVETQAPVTDETLFQAASMSKPVAAMMSLKAVQLGRFGLDQDVNTVLKSWKLPDNPFGGGVVVTPRMLMSHTSGMGDGFGFPGYEPGKVLPSLPQILDGQKPSILGPVRLTAPAMTVSRYSGGAVEIQQLALTDAMGQPFATLADDWIFGPLEMKHSSFDQPLPADRQVNAAHAHSETGAAMGPPWHVYPEQAAAGLWTTAADYARFMAEVQSELAGKSTRVLSRDVARNMVTPVGVGPFAVGFRVKPLGEGWYFQHAGSNWGFRSEAIAHVAKGYGVVVMTNGENGLEVTREVIARVASIYGWDSLDKPAVR